MVTKFQFTPLREGRHGYRLHHRRGHDDFNSRPSARGDARGQHEQLQACIISIHAPPRGATPDEHRHPHSRRISIHAPPRGATMAKRGLDGIELISIHAPPRGATLLPSSSRSFSAFQFTPLREGRLPYYNAQQTAMPISIHAPPRGATIYNKADFQYARISIHAPPRGATSASCREDIPPEISIHAPPRGATPQLSEDAKADIISIHAPPRGATRCTPTTRSRRNYFNSRPSARGDNLQKGKRFGSGKISIHAPPRGATVVHIVFSFADCISIHAPPRGATGFLPLYNLFISFQFTPLREGRQD